MSTNILYLTMLTIVFDHFPQGQHLNLRDAEQHDFKHVKALAS